MINLFNYLFRTSRRSLYRQIGKQFGVNGFRVYRLAHGRAARNSVDNQILDRLMELKIIKRVEKPVHFYTAIKFTPTRLR